METFARDEAPETLITVWHKQALGEQFRWSARLH
jgi:hypothetical protein